MNPPQWSELTAIFGGRFDPPHLGHADAIWGLTVEPGIKRVVILPSRAPAHKPAIANPEQRFEMAKLAFSELKNTEISRLELDRAGPTYTADSLPLLTQKYGPLAFVIGSDQLAELPKWHQFPKILGMAHFIVLTRKGEPPKRVEVAINQLAAASVIRRISDREARTTFGTFMLFQETPAPAISSTQIRESLARSGEGADGLVKSSVLTYLKMHRIYGS